MCYNSRERGVLLEKGCDYLSKRISVALALLIIISTSLLLFDGIIFRFVMLFGLLCAAIELFYSRSSSPLNDSDRNFIAMLIVLSAIFFGLASTPRTNIVVVAGVCAADVFAYIFGKTFGGRLITARPFPHASPNKTWEGIIAAVVGSACVVSATIYIVDGFTFDNMAFADCVLYGCGILAVVGDYIESCYKRDCRVKDSCEFIPESSRVMRIAEELLGGAEGHGGYLDRLDSLIFTSAVLLFVYAPFSLI